MTVQPETSAAQLSEHETYTGRDLPARRRGALRWNTPDEAKASIDNVFADVEKMALHTIDWYNYRKATPSVISRVSRGLAIALLALGGLCPLLNGIKYPPGLAKFDFTLVGYLSFGIAAALMLGDRYGGFSTTWMRYVSTGIRLQRLLQHFQIEWQITRSQLDLDPDPAKQNARIVSLLEQLRGFASNVMAEVEHETEAWMTEFRDSLAQLQRSIREQQQQTPAKAGGTQDVKATGSLMVTVTNFATATQPVFVLVDDVPMAKMTSDTQEIPAVAPGTRKVSVRTTDGSNLVEESAAVALGSGQKAVVVLKLPFPPQPEVVGGAGQQVAPPVSLTDGTVQQPAPDATVPTSQLPEAQEQQPEPQQAEPPPV